MLQWRNLRESKDAHLRTHRPVKNCLNKFPLHFALRAMLKWAKRQREKRRQRFSGATQIPSVFDIHSHNAAFVRRCLCFSRKSYLWRGCYVSRTKKQKKKRTTTKTNFAIHFSIRSTNKQSPSPPQMYAMHWNMKMVLQVNRMFLCARISSLLSLSSFRLFNSKFTALLVHRNNSLESLLMHFDWR